MDATPSVFDKASGCNACEHYYITHDIRFRYGCRALGFKSQKQPGLAVVAASGQQCQYFEAKKLRAGSR